MKGVIKISMLFFILSCNQSKNEKPTQKKDTAIVDVIRVERINSNDYLQRIKPTDGKFFLEDLSSKLCLVFGPGKHESNTFWNNKNKDSLKGFIIDPTYEEFTNLRELRAQRIHILPKNDSLPICQFKEILLIPFNSNEERIHLTFWKIISADFVKFDRIIHPPIERRYANIVAIDKIELNGEHYLSIYLEGGEGGENWDELIVAEKDALYNFEIIANEVIGYCHDSGDWAKIILKTTVNGFEFKEIRDSMELIDNSWQRVGHKEKRLKTVKI